MDRSSRHFKYILALSKIRFSLHYMHRIKTGKDTNTSKTAIYILERYANYYSTNKRGAK